MLRIDESIAGEQFVLCEMNRAIRRYVRDKFSSKVMTKLKNCSLFFSSYRGDGDQQSPCRGIQCPKFLMRDGQVMREASETVATVLWLCYRSADKQALLVIPLRFSL